MISFIEPTVSLGEMLGKLLHTTCSSGLGQCYHSMTSIQRGEGEWIFFFFKWLLVVFVVLKFELEDWIMAVGEEKTTEKGFRETVGPKHF